MGNFYCMTRTVVEVANLFSPFSAGPSSAGAEIYPGYPDIVFAGGRCGRRHGDFLSFSRASPASRSNQSQSAIRARTNPLDFIARLATLVPKPRVNLARFHWVFGPNCKHRALVTPAARGLPPVIAPESGRNGIFAESRSKSASSNPARCAGFH